MSNTLETYRTALRDFLRDTGGLNRLLSFEEESSNDFLDLYLNMSLGFLNFVPPVVDVYSFESFPFPALLIHQATIEALISNNIVNTRNDLQYNNGGLTVKVADASRYLQTLQLLYRTTDMEINILKQIKVAANIMGGFGGVNSPYAWIHGRAATLRTSTIEA